MGFLIDVTLWMMIATLVFLAVAFMGLWFLIVVGLVFKFYGWATKTQFKNKHIDNLLDWIEYAFNDDSDFIIILLSPVVSFCFIVVAQFFQSLI